MKVISQENLRRILIYKEKLLYSTKNLLPHYLFYSQILQLDPTPLFVTMAMA